MSAVRLLLEQLTSAGTLVVASAGAVVFAWFVSLERRGRAHVVVAVVLLVVLVESFTYASQTSVRGALFRPAVFGTHYRLLDLLIPVALVARLVVRGAPARVTPAGLTWVALGAWYLAAFAVGMAAGNVYDLALFHAKAVLYIGGGVILAAGIDASVLTDRTTVTQCAAVLGVLTAVAMATTTTDTWLELDLPLAPDLRFFELGADTVTVLAAIGIAIVTVASTWPGGRAVALVCSVPLVLSPLATTQRAALAGLAAAAAVLVGVVATRTWRSRTRIRGGDAVVVLAALTAPLVLNVIVTASSPEPLERRSPVPFATELEGAFFASEKAQSAETRVNLWEEGWRQIRDRPMTGHGLGQDYRVDRAATDRDLVGGGFHNVPMDVAVRAGLVGLGLLVAVAVSFTRSVRHVWVSHPDRAVAAVAFGCGLAVLAVMTKGLFESVFEKYRLAVLLGLSMGLVYAAEARMRADDGATGADAGRPALVA